VTEIQLKEKYQVLPSMPPEQFEALKVDIAERGVLVPIDVDKDGHILDGHRRYQACVELRITDFPTIVRPGLSGEDRRVFARKDKSLEDIVALLDAAAAKAGH
jgi:ParB-like chromosome segregation protein Spo0J